MEFIQHNWMALAAIAALVIVPRLGKLPWGTIRAYLANEEPATTPASPAVPESGHGLLELQEHWRCLTDALDDAAESEAASAMREVVAPALGRLTFRVKE